MKRKTFCIVVLVFILFAFGALLISSFDEVYAKNNAGDTATKSCPECSPRQTLTPTPQNNPYPYPAPQIEEHSFSLFNVIDSVLQLIMR